MGRKQRGDASLESLKENSQKNRAPKAKQFTEAEKQKIMQEMGDINKYKPPLRSQSKSQL